MASPKANSFDVVNNNDTSSLYDRKSDETPQETLSLKQIMKDIARHIFVASKKDLPRDLASYIFDQKRRFFYFSHTDPIASPIVDVLNSIKLLIFTTKDSIKRSHCMLRFVAFLDIFITTLEELGFDEPGIFRNCYPPKNCCSIDGFLPYKTDEGEYDIDRINMYFGNVKGFIENDGEDFILAFSSSYKDTVI
jgi:hypothetical protein